MCAKSWVNIRKCAITIITCANSFSGSKMLVAQSTNGFWGTVEKSVFIFVGWGETVGVCLSLRTAYCCLKLYFFLSKRNRITVGSSTKV